MEVLPGYAFYPTGRVNRGVSQHNAGVKKRGTYAGSRRAVGTRSRVLRRALALRARGWQHPRRQRRRTRPGQSPGALPWRGGNRGRVPTGLRNEHQLPVFCLGIGASACRRHHRHGRRGHPRTLAVFLPVYQAMLLPHGQRVGPRRSTRRGLSLGRRPEGRRALTLALAAEPSEERCTHHLTPSPPHHNHNLTHTRARGQRSVYTKCSSWHAGPGADNQRL